MARTDHGYPGIYNASANTLADGEGSAFALDVNGNLKTVVTTSISTGWTSFQDLGANATLNVKATTGNVFSLYCHNLNAAARYIQLHNTATVPAGSAVPAFTFLIPANGTTLIDGSFWGADGFNFTTGIAFASSTAEGIYTAGTAGEQVTQIMFS